MFLPSRCHSFRDILYYLWLLLPLIIHCFRHKFAGNGMLPILIISFRTVFRVLYVHANHLFVPWSTHISR
ncbi:hypothetical protein DFS33DRAFT_1329020 [Desarmillaria ectypa]|nr:hypothetical protein DFS33DRAFT_1329020 [Desarmillaria ectypa]